MESQLPPALLASINAAQNGTPPPQVPIEQLPNVVDESKRCILCGVEPVKSPRSEFGVRCYRERRKKQLADNNVVWLKRVAKGTAGHHVTYKGKLTAWAAGAPKTAKQAAEAMAKRAERQEEPIPERVRAAKKLLARK